MLNPFKNLPRIAIVLRAFLISQPPKQEETLLAITIIPIRPDIEEKSQYYKQDYIKCIFEPDRILRSLLKDGPSGLRRAKHCGQGRFFMVLAHTK